LKSSLTFPLLGLSPLLLAFFVWGLDFSTELSVNQSEEIGANVPDAIVENPRLKQYNLYGNLEQLIQGTELLSFSREDRLMVSNPSFVLSKNSGDLWDITADQGRFHNRNNTFELAGEVKMQRQSERFPLSLSTQSLELNLDLQRVQTNSEVLIEAPGNRISGIGFYADLNTNQFEITSKVVSIHDFL
jgi:LPS export ABC transporter protein LptC